MSIVDIVLVVVAIILWVNVGINAVCAAMSLDNDYIFNVRDTKHDTWGRTDLWLKVLYILTAPVWTIWYNNFLVLPYDPSRNDDIVLPDNIDEIH